MVIKQLLSYDTILNDKASFRKSRLDVLDTPGTYFFKVIFYFNNPGDDSIERFTSNLLGWDDGETDGGVWTGDGKPSLKESASHTLETDDIGAQFGSQPAAISYNTAYNYLCMNGEWERARNLRDFIFMLSEISANEPWYFKGIEGLDTALERKWNTQEGMKADDSLPQITIKCLQDSVDSRITTMLGLYRSALWSQTWKREIVPANLRKFDMGVYIFQPPTHGDSYKTTGKRMQGYGEMMDGDTFAGCHYFEFHDCEIDPNSIKSTFSAIDNSTGTQIEPSITISYNDCFVSTYNDQLCRAIGDFVKADLDSRYNALDFTPDTALPDSTDTSERESEVSEKTKAMIKTVGERISQGNNYNRDTGFNLGTALIDNVTGIAENTARKLVRKAYLGNVYGLSMSQIVGVGQELLSGDVVGAVNRGVTVGKATVKSIREGDSVIHDTIPSLTQRRSPITWGNVAKNLVRNL